MSSYNCLCACYYLYSPLSCELLLGRHWIFYIIRSLAPRACNTYLLGGLLWNCTSIKPPACLPTCLCIQPSGPGPDSVSLPRLKMMRHMLPSTCNHVTDQNLLSLYSFFKYQLNHLICWATPDYSKPKWCLLLWCPILSAWNICN